MLKHILANRIHALAQKSSIVLIRGLSRNALQISTERESIWNRTRAFHALLQESMTAIGSLLRETPQTYTQRLITAKGSLARLQTSAKAIACSSVPTMRSITQDYICLRRTREELNGEIQASPKLQSFPCPVAEKYNCAKDFSEIQHATRRSWVHLKRFPCPIDEHVQLCQGLRGRGRSQKAFVGSPYSRFSHVHLRMSSVVPKTARTRPMPRGFLSLIFGGFHVHLQTSSIVIKTSRMRAEPKDIHTAILIVTVVLLQFVRKQYPGPLCHVFWGGRGGGLQEGELWRE